MSYQAPLTDPFEFVRNLWGNMGLSLPGMVTPTLDVNELDKRIADLKAVEGWLRMNLNMLQMTTQGLEMQRMTLAAVKAMGEQARQGEPQEIANPFASMSQMWWQMVNQAAQAQTMGTDSHSVTSGS